jgi:aminomethyltransferase
MLRRPYGQERQDDLWVQIYTNKELKWDHQMCRARIVERPFFKPTRRSATPALDY